jgi:hypothetical protein
LRSEHKDHFTPYTVEWRTKRHAADHYTVARVTSKNTVDHFSC